MFDEMNYDEYEESGEAQNNYTNYEEEQTAYTEAQSEEDYQ